MSDIATRKKLDQLTAEIQTLSGLIDGGSGGLTAGDEFDEKQYTYVTSGNGVGEIETVVYKLASVTVATVTFGYDGQGRIVSQVRS